jgi:formylglycine-generating enzyme required for sulfatase activity
MKHSTFQLFNLSTAAAIAFAIAMPTFADMTVTDVTARQRWPWNSLVDVDFTIAGAAGEKCAIGITATCKGGAQTLTAKTYATEPVATNGANRVVWNLGADYPDLVAKDLRVSVTAAPLTETSPIYLVVDVSDGADAESWPVRYTTEEPAHTVGEADACKTTEIWLKRVKAGTFSSSYKNSGASTYSSYTCTLTNDFYLGIFPVTQAQCFNLTGDYMSSFTNAEFRATRPANSITLGALQDPAFDAADPALSIRSFSSTCILGRLRDRTGLGFLVPTEWQWEYACRGGETLGSNYRYPNCQYRGPKDDYTPPTDYEWKDESGMWDARYGTAYVDQSIPNAWGFYDMVGNVWEWSLNKMATITAGDTLMEPLGPAGFGGNRTAKGVAWSFSNQSTDFQIRNHATARGRDYATNIHGVRLCLPVWNVR